MSIPPTAPHWLGAVTVPTMMRQVLVALLPVAFVSTVLFGLGIVINLLWCAALCLAFEAATLRVRGRPLQPALGDGSALVTAALIALCLPPLTPWWASLTACLFAIVLAKHVYGGLGYNLFNPAMVGYVAALIAFPEYLANWPGLGPDRGWPGFGATLQFFATGGLPASAADALSGATPLDAVKYQLAQMRTLEEIAATEAMGWFAGYGWEWINLAALAGGAWILRKRATSWHAPAGMLGSLAVLYFAGFAIDPATNPSPVFGLLSGGTILAAFFIVTDPVSGAASNLGRIVFGIGVGVLTYVLRRWGAYPDGIAFAVLLMNMAAPLIDRYTLPRVYGHRKRP